MIHRHGESNEFLAVRSFDSSDRASGADLDGVARGYGAGRYVDSNARPVDAAAGSVDRPWVACQLWLHLS
ncbi:hypothetical protein [Kribbella sp. VKM Ac-2571]|uniref:hypothetical protein n=1 Tax=Kribbella sp. VKM Ac-2571 TaxID=2512222 RepID=UPI00105D7EEE|nr:hypothetical protein [Kribbella sp. VKM Ac-2571]